MAQEQLLLVPYAPLCLKNDADDDEFYSSMMEGVGDRKIFH